ncbi:MAG: acetyl-CoA decarbonylase/synthase complex subunit gamma [Armatimonadetes bacterium]|nr:acetyl-CoA decarbonylase/synthase complex subunit gamma [Armatimonadota bacterium]
MALTAIQIYQLLPKTNCGDCGVPTCLAFAMKVAQKQAAIDECPHVSDEAKAALGAAAAPPMATITIGTGDRALTLGGETVLFRHEETFYHPTGFAVRLRASLGPDEIARKAREISDLVFDRVGQAHRVDLVAVEDTGDAAAFVQAVDAAAANTDMPLMLITSNPSAADAAAEKLEGKKPLLYAAEASNFDEMVSVAKNRGCVLTVKANGDVAELVQLSEKAKELGLQELTLDSGARDPSTILQHQTIIRRACLKQKVRSLGYPTVVMPTGEGEEIDLLWNIGWICKYAGIVVFDTVAPEILLPAITARLNIYTDPQKPIQIGAGLYQVGEPDETSPVLVTTNFSLTYYTVEGEVSASKVPAWIVVVDTEGTSVLTAWAADKFTPETIAKTVKECGVEEKVSHRKLVIPGGVAVLKGKLEDELGWDVMVGPREATGIPKFLKTEWASAA